MRRCLAGVGLAGLLAFAAACAPTTKTVEVDPVLAEAEARKQREIALEWLARDERRLFRVSYPLVAAAVPLCKERVRPSIGIHYRSVHSYVEEMREAATSVLGLDETWRVFLVAPGSAAAEAGLAEGDAILAVEGVEVPIGEESAEDFADLLEKELEKPEVEFRVRRGGGELPLRLRPQRVCDYAVGLSQSDRLNAFADGDAVVVTRGLMRFTENETELATVVAHEIAHNAMGHIDARRGNATIGMILDLLVAVVGINTQGAFSRMTAGVYSQEFEEEADYVGLYIMARAGLDIEKTSGFWRRMAAVHPEGIHARSGASHPSTPYRFLALEKTVEEINGKRAKGEPLLPERKDE